MVYNLDKLDKIMDGTPRTVQVAKGFKSKEKLPFCSLRLWIIAQAYIQVIISVKTPHSKVLVDLAGGEVGFKWSLVN